VSGLWETVMECPDANVLAAYVEYVLEGVDTMTTQETVDVHEHLKDCEDCRSAFGIAKFIKVAGEGM